MAKEITLAQKKWERKVKGSKWKAQVTGKKSDYCSGIAEFLGVSTCNPEVAESWEEGVDAVSASDFDTAVRGKGPKWARRYTEKMAGVSARRAREEY